MGRVLTKVDIIEQISCKQIRLRLENVLIWKGC